jgi:hypothetical protein
VSLYAAQIQSYDPYGGYYLNVNTQGQLVTAELVFNLIGVIVSIIFIIMGLAQMSSRKIRLGVSLPFYSFYSSQNNIDSLLSAGFRF